MRVGIDASNIRAGGGLTILMELLKLYAPGDHGVSSITIWCNREVSEKLSALNPKLQTVNVPELNAGFVKRFSWRVLEFPKAARAKVDALLIPGGMPVVSRLKNISMSLNLLPFMPHEYKRDADFKQRLKYRLLRVLNYRSLSRADGAIFLNENARHVIYEGRQSEQPFALCPLGVDPRFFLDSRKVKPNDAYSFESPFRFIYVSTVNSYKHQWHVADAVKRARGAGYPITVDFIGGAAPAPLKRLEAAIEANGGEASGARYIGKVPFMELHEYYHKADGFIFASTCENMPNIGVEAMAAALPITSSKLEPMKGLFDGCALLFDAESPESIAKALQDLFDDAPRRERLSQQARAQAQQYSWENFYAGTLGFIQKIAAAA